MSGIIIQYCVCMCVCEHLRMLCMCVHACVHVCVCACTCMCVCACECAMNTYSVLCVHVSAWSFITGRKAERHCYKATICVLYACIALHTIHSIKCSPSTVVTQNNPNTDTQVLRKHLLEVEALESEEGFHNARCLDSGPQNVLLCWDIVRLCQSIQRTQVAT